MSALQIFVAVFALAVLVITVLAIRKIVATPELPLKPLWVIGSLVGSFGFTINWTVPGNLYGWIGLQIPFVNVVRLFGSDAWIVKVGVPIVAIIALVKLKGKKADGSQIDT